MKWKITVLRTNEQYFVDTWFVAIIFQVLLFVSMLVSFVPSWVTIDRIY